MKVQVFQLFFKSDGNGGLLPMDGELYTLAVTYAADNLAEAVDFTNFKNVWVACEVDEQGKPVRVLGVLCMVLRADFPVCRFTDNAAVIKLVQRVNDYLHDNGARGQDALIHIKEHEPPEARCPNYREWMQAFDLQPADRWTYKVR